VRLAALQQLGGALLLDGRTAEGMHYTREVGWTHGACMAHACCTHEGMHYTREVVWKVVWGVAAFRVSRRVFF
jgi:hypothetical protein